MSNIDTPILINWIVSGLIACIFGAISAWLAYRYQKRRDDIAWNREKERMQHQFQNDLERLREEVKQELYKQQEIAIRSEVLPTIWKNLLNAVGRTRVVTALYKRYPDLNTWADEAISDFLGESVLSDLHRKQLVEATDKTDFYQRTIYWYEVEDAHKTFNEFHNHLLYNKIYLDDASYTELYEIDNLFTQLFLTIELNRDYPVGIRGNLNQDSFQDFNIRGDILVQKIGKLIQQNVNS